MSWSKEKQRNYMREYRSRPEIKIKKSYEHKQRKYGISPEDFKQLLTSQNGVCAICKTLGYQRSKMEPTLGLCIDHNHKTNKVRGLLCYRCNAALGNLDDNIELLKSAITYLSKES